MSDVRGVAAGISRRGILGAGIAFGLAACTSSSSGGDATQNAVTQDAAAVEVPVLCRQAWGAAEMSGEPVEHTVQRLTVHHSAVPLRDNADAPGQLRAIQRDHQSQLWPDIAYHYLIDRDGNIYAGRDPAFVGDTFTPYDPTGHFLVCLLGHFDDQRLTRGELRALADILAVGAATYDVSPATIAGHNHYEPSTSCPGRHLDAIITDGSLQESVERVLAEGTPTLVDVCGAEGSSKVAAIEST